MNEQNPPVTSEELQKKLEESFGILMTELTKEEMDVETLQEKGYWKAPKDVAARLSPLLQSAVGLGANQAVRDTFQDAVKLVLPSNLPAGAKPMHRIDMGKEVFSFNYQVPGAKGIVGQAGWEKINPATADIAQVAYSAFSMASVVTGQYFMQRIDKKMESIQESTNSILQFLELDKRSELQAEQMFLNETVQDMEDITLCESQRQASVVNAQNTRKKALAATLFYGSRIESVTEEISSKDYKASKWEETQKQLLSYIANYQLSLWAYGMSIFLEVMLTGNTERAYLRRLLERMREQQKNYDQCLASCYERLIKYAEEADPGKLAFGIAKGAAAVAPVIGVPLAEWLGKVHKDEKEKLKGRLSDEIIDLVETCAAAGQLQDIMENIQQLDEISNEPMELIFENGHVYMKTPMDIQEQGQTA